MLSVDGGFVGVSWGQWARNYDTGDTTDAYWTSTDGLDWQIQPMLPDDGQRPAALIGRLLEVVTLTPIDGIVTALSDLNPLLFVRVDDAWATVELPLPEGYVPNPNDATLYLGRAIAQGPVGVMFAAELNLFEGDLVGYVWIRATLLARGDWPRRRRSAACWVVRPARRDMWCWSRTVIMPSRCGGPATVSNGRPCPSSSSPTSTRT